MLLVEDQGEQKIYDSLLVGPEKLSIFSSELAVAIIRELAKKPQCAIDVARALKQHEQKIYYHLRKMKEAGIVKLDRSEARHGMTAKIYSLTSPVIATKLKEIENPVPIKHSIKNLTMLNFLHPFIKDGKMNSKVVIGDSYSHGRFDAYATEGPHIFDFAVILGNYLDTLNFPFYELDTEVSADDLKENLILFGNPRTNVIIDKINLIGHKYFEDDSKILSKDGRTTHEDPRIGAIIKTINPFNKNKRVLIIGGIRTRGLQAAIIAVTRGIEKIMIDKGKNDDVMCIVKGLDKMGNKKIDAVNILE